MTLLRRLMAAALVLACLAIVAGWREIPRWRLDGTAPVAVVSITSGRESVACPPAGGRIAIYGDSHVSGTGGTEKVIPFGRMLALTARMTVDLYGHGGDTAPMGEQRWKDAQPGADIVLLAYGTNDAAPRGWLSGKQPIPLDEFTASLQRQIERWQARGADVTLIAPPPPGSAAMFNRIAPYRAAVAKLGEAKRITVLDPAEAFRGCPSGPALLGHDALHMSAAGHLCLGQWLAATLCPAQR